MDVSTALDRYKDSFLVAAAKAGSEEEVFYDSQIFLIICRVVRGRAPRVPNLINAEMV